MSLKSSNSKRDMEDKNAIYKQLFAGAVAGVTGSICTQPLDVLRVRLQSTASKHHHGEVLQQHFFKRTFSLLRHTYVNEGMRGLYRGLMPMLIAAVPSRALYFATYTQTRDFSQQFFFPEETEEHFNHPPIHLLAATAAIMLSSSILNPLFFVKTRMQLQGPNSPSQYKYAGYLDCVKQVYQKEGIKSFYKGLTASWLGVFENGIYFVLYEQAKYSLAHYRYQKHSEKCTMKQEQQNFDAFKRECLTPFDFLALSATCKFAASAITYPHEVLKTRMREVDASGKHMYKHIREAIVKIWKQEGWKTFYTGIEPHLLRTVPNTAITFVTFEFIMKLFEKIKE